MMSVTRPAPTPPRTPSRLNAAGSATRLLTCLSLVALGACGSSRRADAPSPAEAPLPSAPPPARAEPDPPAEGPAAEPIQLHLTDFRPTFDDPGCPSCTQLTVDHIAELKTSASHSPTSRFGAHKLLDGRRDTAWCAPPPSQGHAWVELRLREPAILHTVAIAPGFLKSAESLFNYAHPAELQLSTDAGHDLRVRLDPYPEDYAEGPGYALPATWPGQLHAAKVSTIRLLIPRVHAGRTQAELCVSTLFVELLDAE